MAIVFPTWIKSEKLTPEQRLLLVAVGAPCCAEKFARPEWLGDYQLEWEVLASTASRHGLSSLLCRFLEAHCADAVPAEILAELQQERRQTAMRNLRMTGELWAIQESFAQRGIAAVPFKGPTLAALIEEDLSWRSFGDLDVLVDRRSVAAASELLKQRGYELTLDWSATRDERFLDVTYDLEFRHPSTGVMVELHWELFPRYFGFAFDFAETQRNLIPVKTGGKPMRTLAEDDLLPYLCAHGAKHFWATLNGVVDVARLIESRSDWRWDAMLERARRRNLERVTLLGLLLAKGLLGAPVPDWIEKRATEDKALVRLARETVAEMFSPRQSEGGMRRQFRYFYNLQPDWRARLRYLFRLLVAPNVGDWEFRPLSRQWALLYAVLRPLRLLKKYGGLKS